MSSISREAHPPQNVCIIIPLLKALRDVPTYTKTIRDLCVKIPSIKHKYPPTINVVGSLTELILRETPSPKYEDLGNLIAIVQINSLII